MYTKGPWKVFGPHIIGGEEITTQVALIAKAEWMAPGEEEANANLMAASPAMYEALQDALNWIEARLPDTLDKSIHLVTYRQALALAEGKE